MILEKYKRWPIAIILNGEIWRRSKTKGWFQVEYGEKGKGGYTCISAYITHPKFIGAKQVWSKKELETKIINQ